MVDLEAQLQQRDGDIAYYREHLGLADETERLLRAEVRSLAGPNPPKLHAGPLWSKQGSSSSSNGQAQQRGLAQRASAPSPIVVPDNGDGDSESSKGNGNPLGKLVASCVACGNNQQPQPQTRRRP